MDLFTFLVNTYNGFLSIFPPPIHWVVTLAVILIMISGFIGLVRHNILFVLLLIPLAPLLLPPLLHLYADMAAFFVYLLHTANQPMH